MLPLQSRATFRLLLKVPEHTWGVDIKKTLMPLLMVVVVLLLLPLLLVYASAYRAQSLSILIGCC